MQPCQNPEGDEETTKLSASSKLIAVNSKLIAVNSRVVCDRVSPGGGRLYVAYVLFPSLPSPPQSLCPQSGELQGEQVYKFLAESIST